jgi:hypothetical protein
LHELASHDPNRAVRRLAIMSLKNGSPQSDTIRLLAGLADSDEEDRDLREAAGRVSAALTRKSRER